MNYADMSREELLFKIEELEKESAYNRREWQIEKQSWVEECYKIKSYGEDIEKLQEMNELLNSQNVGLAQDNAKLVGEVDDGYSRGQRDMLKKCVEIVEGIDDTTWYDTGYTQLSKVVIKKLEALKKMDGVE